LEWFALDGRAQTADRGLGDRDELNPTLVARSFRQRSQRGVGIPKAIWRSSIKNLGAIGKVRQRVRELTAKFPLPY
jgi:hypothetical protein